MAAITGWSSKMNFQRNKSKNNHDKDNNCRSTSPGRYSVSQLFGSSPKRRSPPQRSVTTQLFSSTPPPKYDDVNPNGSIKIPTAAVPVPPGRTITNPRISSCSTTASGCHSFICSLFIMARIKHNLRLQTICHLSI